MVWIWVFKGRELRPPSVSPARTFWKDKSQRQRLLLESNISSKYFWNSIAKCIKAEWREINMAGVTSFGHESRPNVLKMRKHALQGFFQIYLTTGWGWRELPCGESRPNVLKIKTKPKGFVFCLLPHLPKQVLDMARKQKTSAFALVFIYPYSRRDLNPHGLMAIGF